MLSSSIGKSILEDLQATRERYYVGSKRKDCFLVAMNFARPSMTGTIQRPKSHKAL